MGRKALWIVAILLLFNTGLVGFYNGVTEFAEAHTPLQKSVTAGVFLYGIFGLSAAVALLVRHRWSVPLSAGWAVVVTYVASMARLLDATIGAAMLACLGAVLLGVFVVWCARSVTRPTIEPERPHDDSR